MLEKQQGKVSMVVPCYNKENYIGPMLESVLAQQWNNLELLLINDGSTDNTRDIIVSYLPKLKKRGYKVLLIDQENGGCCKAVHTGLVNMTGEYFCLVDADDEIEPEYVSLMAGWLDDNSDYEWTACSLKAVTKIDGKNVEANKTKRPLPQDSDNLLIHYIFRKVITTVWIYMIRTSYIKRCKMIDNFYTERSKTYEPLIAVPLAAYDGRLKFFDIALYRYNKYASDLFGFTSFELAKNYYDDYFKMYEWAINRLKIEENQKKKYLAMAGLSYYLELFTQVPQIAKMQNIILCEDVIKLLHNTFPDNTDISVSEIMENGYESLFDSIEAGFLPAKKVYKRIIGYGALGKVAQKLLPQLIYTNYFPTELWDINGDSDRVKQPEIDSLNSDDLVLVFPTNETAIDTIKFALNYAPCTVYYYNDINNLIVQSKLKFPKLERMVRDYKC